MARTPGRSRTTGSCSTNGIWSGPDDATAGPLERRRRRRPHPRRARHQRRRRGAQEVAPEHRVPARARARRHPPRPRMRIRAAGEVPAAGPDLRPLRGHRRLADDAAAVPRPVRGERARAAHPAGPAARIHRRREAGGRVRRHRRRLGGPAAQPQARHARGRARSAPGAPARRSPARAQRPAEREHARRAAEPHLRVRAGAAGPRRSQRAGADLVPPRGRRALRRLHRRADRVPTGSRCSRSASPARPRARSARYRARVHDPVKRWAQRRLPNVWLERWYFNVCVRATR